MDSKKVGDTAVAESVDNNTSPWGKKTWANSPPSAPCSLLDVMSEQLATDLQHDEEESNVPPDDLGFDPSVLSSDDSVDNDLLIAQMLQLQYDKEHDAILKKEEQHINKQSKVSVSLTNFRTVHPALLDDDSGDSSVEEEEDVDEPQLKFKNGISGKGKNITTKHDATICARKNARAMDNFPPEFDTGDGRGIDMKLPNHVYNKLKVHSIAESKRSARLHEKKEHATSEHAIDPKTRLAMYKLVNSGILDDINGIVSTGKESVVFHATGGRPEDRKVPAECALKVFKTTLNEFKKRGDYIRGDYRFAKDEFKKQNPRKVIKIWAEKEMINLNLMRRCGIPCPEVVILKKHILVMSFIGHNQIPAVKLKNANLSSEQAELAYVQTVEAMKKLHSECKLVHADLSEYNILWHDASIFLIDVSQSVDLSHPHAYEFLLRDCAHVSQFFTKLGVSDVMNEYELFNDITGMRLQGEGEEFLAQIQEYEKQEVYLSHGEQRKEYQFDYFFDKTTKSHSMEGAVKDSELFKTKDGKTKHIDEI